jgi:hypothetical protein
VKLYAEAEKAIAASGVEVELEKVEDVTQIAQYGFMMTPALVIDNQVKASGRIPDFSEIVPWIIDAAAKRQA